ncbi:hypothetical protein RHSIM_Rhsim13G0191800 [Rhododendron simsii]|uniref:Uncharacterized protein n=1 Tax=Rhododendron simsii TaxID=118357 RepID=A0A834G1T9_RHOSS|nr:hypothetical protein RHSIM_Rhsim13G0191800 [Rhododendron simsii]
MLTNTRRWQFLTSPLLEKHLLAAEIMKNMVGHTHRSGIFHPIGKIVGLSFETSLGGTNKSDSDGKEAEKGLNCSDQEVFAQQRSENHRGSPIYDEALGAVANVVNVESQSKDINSSSTHGLESIVEDSMGLTSLFQEAEDTRGKSQGDEILSHSVPMVTDPTKLINEGKEAWNEPLVLDSGNNIRASQFAGINLMVDFRPKEVKGKNRSQPFGDELVLVESNGTSGSPCEISGYIADTPDQEQVRIEEELQKTIRASTKLGIKCDDAGIMRMKKMIEQEAKDLESILRDNPFAPLQRKKIQKLQRNESRVRHRSSLAL